MHFCASGLFGLLFAATLASRSRGQSSPEPLRYTIHVRVPTSQTIDVDVVVPSDRRDSVYMMMPIWSPGMYALQTYGDRVTTISAKASDGTTLGVTRASPSRWAVKTHGRGR